MSARDAILALAAGTPEMEPLAGMDGAFVRRLSVEGADALNSAEDRGMALFVETVCDATGAALFTMADAPQLRKLPIDTFNAYGRQIMAFNGLDAKADESAEKNSEETPADG